MAGPPTLTSLARAGGCAAKYPAARLEKLLAGLVPAESYDLLVGLDPADDAAVYRLDAEHALVFTVDFFPPVVDDPQAFGTIAATNALNDVFAMGGLPLLALSIAEFPEELPRRCWAEILGGADEVVRAAGAILAGGHTIRDDEPKYGLAVVGTVHPDGIWPKTGARAGDALFLTKPLGTGLVLQAAAGRAGSAGRARRRRRLDETLNRDGAAVLRAFGPNAVTDVTGFGLLGHAYEMAYRSGVRLELDALELPAARLPPSSPKPASVPAVTAATATRRPARGELGHGCPRGARRWIRRPPAACWSRFPRTRQRFSSPRSRRRASISSAWAGPSRAWASSSGRTASNPGARLKPGTGLGRAPGFTRVAALRTLAGSPRARSTWGSLVSPRGFMHVAAATTVAMFFVITSGAFVRLTASGLGCEKWPRCGTAPFPTQGNQHRSSSSATGWSRSSGSCSRSSRGSRAARCPGCPALARNCALGAFARYARADPARRGDDHARPASLAVMSHFLLALVVLGLSVVVGVEASPGVVGRAAALRPRHGCVTWSPGPDCRSLRLSYHGRGHDRFRSAPRLGGERLPAVAAALRAPAPPRRPRPSPCLGCSLMFPLIGYLLARRSAIGSHWAAPGAGGPRAAR